MRHLQQEPGDNSRPSYYHQRCKRPGFQQVNASHLPEWLLCLCRERWEQHKNEYGDQILQHQPAHSHLPMRSIEQSLIHQIADHNHGTGNSESQSEQDAGSE